MAHDWLGALPVFPIEQRAMPEGDLPALPKSESSKKTSNATRAKRNARRRG
jgi:ATP-dependent DNA helicase DinG